MSNIQSYNALIDRFHAFASGHFILKRFSHGQIEVSDLEKFGEYPFMHVVPSNVTYAKGMKTFSFQIVLADLPRDKEDKPEYQREVLSDLQRIAEDLVAEITNHRVLFGDLITVQNVSLEPFLEEFQHTLTGWTISLDLLVPYYWDACSIPAEWNDMWESSTGGTGSILTFIDSINRDNNGNVSLVNDEATPAPNYYYGTNGAGVRGWYLTTDNIGLTCETIGDCQTIIDIEAAIDALEEEILLKADITSISAVGFSNNYNDLDNKPTIPTATSDLTNDSGFITIGDVPSQVNSDWNATSGVAEILNKPTLTNGTVTAVTATAPMSSTGGATPNLSMSSANGTTNGYLLSSDWLIFNGKFNTPAGTTLQYVRGDGSLATFPTIPTSLPPSGAAGGDLTGTYPDPTVHRVHGIDMQNGTPTANDTWVYGGSPAKWQHQHLNASQVDNDSSVTGATVKLALEHLDSTKQATLVSGTNIKTVNSNSLLGAGNISVGTVTSVSALTLGTTGTDLSSTVANGTSTPVITLNVPTASATNRGALSSTDWSTFNGKQSTITLTTTGTSGAATFIGNTLNIPQYAGTNIYNSDGSLTAARTLTLNTFALTIAGTSSSRFFANGNIGIGTTTDAGYKLDVNGSTRVQGILVAAQLASATTHGIALGYNAQGTAAHGIAIGYNALASANPSYAFGYAATASAQYATAFSRGIAAAVNSIAWGNNTRATGEASIAGGEGAHTYLKSQLSIGTSMTYGGDSQTSLYTGNINTGIVNSGGTYSFTGVRPSNNTFSSDVSQIWFVECVVVFAVKGRTAAITEFALRDTYTVKYKLAVKSTNSIGTSIIGTPVADGIFSDASMTTTSVSFSIVSNNLVVNVTPPIWASGGQMQFRGTASFQLAELGVYSQSF
jgi:hypothetical protein